MNLEKELRAVLSQEAEMRTTPTPDIAGMVDRGQERLRRRNSMRLGLAAAAVLLVGGGVYGITQIGGGDPDAGVATVPSEPSEAANPPSWQRVPEGPVDAGTYRTYVGAAADGKEIEADLTIEGSNWDGSNYPVAYDGEERFAGIGAYKPDSVAGGCKMEAGLKPAATEPQQLVQQLTRMPHSDVVQQPTPTTAFGYNATHLRLRIDAGCGEGAFYQVAEAPPGTRGISYFGEKSEGVSRIVIIDFWVVDVNGTTVVVDMFHTEDAPRDLVYQAAAARDSITFVTAE
jgi:hypothetical protein